MEQADISEKISKLEQIYAELEGSTLQGAFRLSPRLSRAHQLSLDLTDTVKEQGQIEELYRWGGSFNEKQEIFAIVAKDWNRLKRPTASHYQNFWEYKKRLLSYLREVISILKRANGE